MVATAPEKMINRHLLPAATDRHDAVEAQADEELLLVMRRIARRADLLRANCSTLSDRDLWLTAQAEILGFAH